MIGYKISINNKQIAIIGSNNLRDLIAMVNTHFSLLETSNNGSKIEEKVEHKLHLGGIKFASYGSNYTEHLSWGENLNIGVGYKIEIIETDTPNPPDNVNTIARNDRQF